jgi:hypothetical protein
MRSVRNAVGVQCESETGGGISVEWDAQTDRDGNYTRPALAM